MPRVITHDVPFIEMSRLIKGRYNGEGLAVVLRCSSNTARERMKNPGKLTLDELKLLCQRGHISREELLSAIRW